MFVQSDSKLPYISTMLKKLLFIILVTSSVFSVQGSGDCSGSVKRLFRATISVDDQLWLAQRSIFIREWKEASQYLAVILRADPQHPVALRLFAKAQYILKNYDVSLAAYKKYEEVYGTSAIVIQSIANSLLKLGRFDEAIAYLDKGLSLDPNDLRMITTKASVYIKQGNYEDALPFVERGLAINSDDTILLAQKIMIFLHFEKFEELLQLARHLKEIAPNDKHVDYNILQSLFGLKRYEEAIALADELIARGGSNKLERLYTIKARSLMELKGFAEAYDVAYQAFKIQPLNTHTHNVLFSILLANKDYHELLTLTDEMIALRNSNPDFESWGLNYARSTALTELGRYNEAFNLIQDNLKMIENYEDFHQYRYLSLEARLLAEMGFHQDALEKTNTLIERFPNEKYLYFQKAKSLLRLSRYDELIENSRQALLRFPDQYKMRGYLAQAYLRTNQIDEAEAAIKTLEDGDIKNYFLGSLELLKGNYSRAIEIFEAMDFASPNKDWKLAESYFRTGQMGKAQEALVRVVQALRRPSIHVIAALIKIEQTGDNIVNSEFLTSLISQLDPAMLSKIAQANEDLVIDWNYAPVDLYHEAPIVNTFYDRLNDVPVNGHTFRSTY